MGGGDGNTGRGDGGWGMGTDVMGGFGEAEGMVDIIW